jgi:Na+/proline symporter
MADIDVVPKRRTNAWVWILLALVVLTVLTMLVIAGRADASTTVQQPDRTIHPAMSNVPATTPLLV